MGFAFAKPLYNQKKKTTVHKPKNKKILYLQHSCMWRCDWVCRLIQILYQMSKYVSG